MPYIIRMISGDYTYLWQAKDWPNWRFDWASLANLMAEANRAQGYLMGRLADAGLGARDQAGLGALTEEVLKTSEIEGEILDARSVRSSVARRLGVDIGALAPVDRAADGVVDMVLDATANGQAPLTQERLFGWHAALFPTGYSGLAKVQVGAWRDDAKGPMQVVSGPLARERVHFEAPPAERLEAEMGRFLDWVNAKPVEPPLLRAGLAHLWFVTLHPFDDGNGRLGRAIGDLLLARADGSTQRFYSLSAQIRRERKAYYAILERTQRGSMDVTVWLAWFLEALLRAELRLGRDRARSGRNLPRTLDLDLIAVAGVEGAWRWPSPPDLALLGAELTLELPHPRARQRAFVTDPIRALGVDFF